MGLLKMATVWLGGCSGCHMSFLDLDEFLIDLAGIAELVYSPIADVKEYPDAGHSFLNAHDPADFNFLVVWLARLTNSRYHEPSAIDARLRILAFFDRYLHDP